MALAPRRREGTGQRPRRCLGVTAATMVLSASACLPAYLSIGPFVQCLRPLAPRSTQTTLHMPRPRPAASVSTKKDHQHGHHPPSRSPPFVDLFGVAEWPKPPPAPPHTLNPHPSPLTLPTPHTHTCPFPTDPAFAGTATRALSGGVRLCSLPVRCFVVHRLR